MGRSVRSSRGRFAAMGGVYHSVQVRCGIFDVKVLVLARSAFGGDHAATVDFLEITIRKLVMPFGVVGFLVVDAQIPFPVFFESMLLQEGIFLLRGRLVLAPCVPFVEHESSFADELLGVLEGPPVEFHCHDLYSSQVSPDTRRFDMLVASRTRSIGRDALTLVNFPECFSRRLKDRSIWLDRFLWNLASARIVTHSVPAPLLTA
jgi:hypothetical protein